MTVAEMKAVCAADFIIQQEWRLREMLSWDHLSCSLVDDFLRYLEAQGLRIPSLSGTAYSFFIRRPEPLLSVQTVSINNLLRWISLSRECHIASGSHLTGRLTPSTKLPFRLPNDFHVSVNMTQSLRLWMFQNPLSSSVPPWQATCALGQSCPGTLTFMFSFMGYMETYLWLDLGPVIIIRAADLCII